MRADRAARNLVRNEYRRIRLASRDSADRRQLRRDPARPAPATVVAHFADDAPEHSLYQLRQWYLPLQALAERLPVAISVRRASVARVVGAECALPVAYLRNTHDVEGYMTAVDPRVVFYVNHWARNFQMMRYGRAMHVFLSHGESEKAYMASGQLRAYDFTFVAGQAAVDRILAALPNYDPAVRTRQIGRPQLDFLPPDRSGGGEVRTVLYAPTYEGDRPSMAYGSVLSHGAGIVHSLLDAGYRVVYRPHPMTGTLSEGYRHADHALREALRRANATLPPGREPHVVDTAADAGARIAESEVAIVDNSAMAFDWLVTGKPLIVTTSAGEATTGSRRSFLSACYRLGAADAARAAEVVARVVADDDLADQRAYWITRHFGDVTTGACTRRFLDATEEIVQLGAAQVALTERRAAQLFPPAAQPDA